MSKSITIHENGVAVLYDGYKPVEAAAGDSAHLEKFIAGHGKMPLYGEHRFIAMRQKEEEQERKRHAN